MVHITVCCVMYLSSCSLLACLETNVGLLGLGGSIGGALREEGCTVGSGTGQKYLILLTFMICINLTGHLQKLFYVLLTVSFRILAGSSGSAMLSLFLLCWSTGKQIQSAISCATKLQLLNCCTKLRTELPLAAHVAMCPPHTQISICLKL